MESFLEGLAVLVFVGFGVWAFHLWVATRRRLRALDARLSALPMGKPPPPPEARVGFMLALLLLVLPTVAHADIGSVVLGTAPGWLGVLVMGALTLASTFHVGDIIASWIQAAKAPAPTIPGHPKLAEGVLALEQASLHVLQDLVTPELLATLDKKLQTDSLASIGAWLATAYGPKLLKDIQEQATTLLGTEIKLVMGSDKDLLEVATLRLGVAASKTVATAKVVELAPSGRPIVRPVPSPADGPGAA